jgi:hypothetical protein
LNKYDTTYFLCALALIYGHRCLGLSAVDFGGIYSPNARPFMSGSNNPEVALQTDFTV